VRVWREDGETLSGLACSETFKCQFCNSDMGFWMAKLQKFSINDGDEIPRSHAIDIEVWCKSCGYWQTHGVAVSPEHYNERTKAVNEILEKKVEAS